MNIAIVILVTLASMFTVMGWSISAHCRFNRFLAAEFAIAGAIVGMAAGSKEHGMTTVILILIIIAFSTSVYAIKDRSRVLHLFSGWLCMLTALIAGAVPKAWGGTIIVLFVFGTINLYFSYKKD